MQQLNESRERWTFALLDAAAQDVRYAWRSLCKSPGFALTAVGVLALAMGASTAAFSVVHAVLLRPLPYRAPERLAMLWSEDLSHGFREGRSALWEVERWRAESRSFEGLAAFDGMTMFLSGVDGVEQITGAGVSPNLFALLGVQPVLGRGFTAEEAGQRQRVVLIGHRFWLARYGGSPSALGATLVLNGSPHQVIGVLPAGFKAARLDADVWEAHATPTAANSNEAWLVVGRLRAGVTLGQAQAEMAAIARGGREQRPAEARNRTVAVVALEAYLVGAQARLGLWMLGGAVFCVFLIAAANVTSLSLARSVARRREMSVRAALGASRGRVVRQWLTEGLLLAAAAGALGTLLASTALDLIRAYGPANLPRLEEIGLDAPALAWAAGVSLLAGALVGLSPAVAALRGLGNGLEGGRSVAGGMGVGPVRRALVVADFALAILLLAGASLLLRSWMNVNGIAPGFRPERVLTMEISAPRELDLPAKRAFYQRLLETIQAMPGVEDAGLMGELFKDNNREAAVTVERAGGTISERLQFGSEEISPEVFRALGTPLRRGRFFTLADGPDALPVAMINEAMARRWWPGGDAVGQRFHRGARDSGEPWYTVVGVVADVRAQGPEREAFPQMYVPLAQSAPPRNVDLFVRAASGGDPQALAGPLRTAVRGVDKNASLGVVTALEQQFGAYTAQRRFQTALLLDFALVALLMAAVGIYGLIQYSMAARTQEIGIRLAIGAQAGQIFRLVLAEGLKLALAGWALGLMAAWWLGQASAGLLYGVTPTDPVTFLAVSGLLAAVATAACYVPARRAMRIEPIQALRQW